ncbi:hypothetical protein M378DRAFT_27029 [Amanita muscaria Koide BX008]|uniref:Uncharacterized protein n=1 Tax=Amanita muscaria (strain Koide BX008) TaxID=946122 RepID=A0A0C2SYV0_AMAMK|nr:hypothetical protein M378DRAFT_27029 [Amanita muscaria Koide BX008]
MLFDDLPLEIIQRIFTFCCGGVRIKEPSQLTQLPGARTGTTQVTLSLACSRWREIVLNTSALWGDVEVIYDARREREPTTASFQFVKNWLGRARGTPISLTITVFTARKLQIAAISQTLLSSFHISNLYLRSIDCPFLVPTNNSHHLERLHLSLAGPVRTDVFPRLPEMPSLKELHLSLRPGDFVDLANLYLIPWHQLHVFTLHEKHWPSQMLFNILQECKSLVECTLLMTSEHGQREYDIVLPNLESLVLDMNLGGSVDPIIRSLTLPKLKSLDITSWNRFAKIPLDPAAIDSMVQRSGFKNLTHFSLSRTTKPVDVSALLKSMPALKSVKLYGPLTFQPETFDDLSSGAIGPLLEDIFFEVITDGEIRLMLKTIRKRREKAKTVPDIKEFVSVNWSLL